MSEGLNKQIGIKIKYDILLNERSNQIKINSKLIKDKLWK
jgi:hypothetical protein